GLMIGSAVVSWWSEETWGPRYLHSAVAPLLLCLAAARRDRPFRLKREVPLAALAGCGLFVSFLGVTFYYGLLHRAALASTRSNLETIQNDPGWNHVRFNLELLRTWIEGGTRERRWPP